MAEDSEEVAVDTAEEGSNVIAATKEAVQVIGAIETICGIFKCMWYPISRRIGYLKDLRSNFEKLKEEAKHLHNARDDINEKIERSGKVHSRQFQDWSDEVAEIKNRVDRIEADNELDGKCLKGCCPNVSSRMKLGKEISATLIEKIPDLKERSKNHDNFMLDPPTPPVETVPAPDIKPGSSIDLTLEEVMGSVRNSDIRKIGIWGMGGVGKTTLMKKLNNLPEIAPMFDVVIWVTVSKDWNIRKVQNEIGQRLSLNLSSEKSDDEVARKIHNKLEKTRYMLLLDDVWDNVNLENVGIPITNSNKGCKIVLTTRSIDVCKKMGTNSNIKVKVLSEVEAWELFREKVGNIIDSPEIQLLGRNVAKECAGLPLAINVVGGALREEADVRVWRNALKELKSANPSEIEGMVEEVFGPLKFSYDILNSVNRKHCFLFGALYPEDYEIPIDEMIECWRASGFLDGDGSLSAAYDRGHAILSHLINASLFEQRFVSYKKECVKMHDVIRDLALRITSMEGNKFFVGTEIESSIPRDEEWQKYKGVSLINYYHKQVKLPERPSCPDLSTLLLQHNYSQLEVIPESFFVSMTALRVLNLSGTRIKSLPPSIRHLVNLCGLYLQKCDDLVELPSEIGALGRLEFLCVGGGIQYLPMEVGQLTNLRRLMILFGKVNESSRMQLPKGILSRLSQLEDLKIFVNNRREELWVSNVPEIIEEVCNLSALNHLSFSFPRLEQFECFIKRNEAWKNDTLASFYFFVNFNSNNKGNYQDAFDPTFFNNAVVRRLIFENGEGLIPDVLKQVLRRTHSFTLKCHQDIRRLSELGNLNSLTYLSVFDCHKIETTLIDKDCVPAHLETAHVRYCHKVKNVFSQGTIQHLTNLKRLTIYECNEVSEVISGDAEYSALPRLESLDLKELPNLERICKQVLAWSSIKYVRISQCKKLRSLPFGSHNSSTLRNIKCKKGLWDALQWEDDGAKAQLEYSWRGLRLRRYKPSTLPRG